MDILSISTTPYKTPFGSSDADVDAPPPADAVVDNLPGEEAS